MDFTIGCNYWASNAGLEMWSRFEEEVIRRDLEQLSSNGINTIRTFPLWSAFQPIEPYYGCFGTLVEYRMKNGERSINPYYLDEEMLSRFERFCDICEEYNIKVIVALLTGWMSGRLYIPTVLYDKNLFTDPIAVMFEQYFIKGFVSQLKSKSAIIAWEAGNECNCLAEAKEPYTSANWTMTISNAIRACDATRPIIASSHVLDLEGNWRIKDQAEACDYLVTHPYPFWSELGYKEKTMSLRTLFHGVAMMRLYGDIGKRPTLIAEIGTMGNMVCNDDNSANFIRINIIEALSHNIKGLLWWCAYNQSKLNYLPYTTNMCEQELGLINEDRTTKVMLDEMNRLGKLISTLPNFDAPTADAVCILSCGQHQWRNAFATYSIATRAGLNITFAYGNYEIPDSDLYIMPGVCGNRILDKEMWVSLLAKVHDDGATLYISNDRGVLAQFEAFSGNQVIDSGRYVDDIEIPALGIKSKRQQRYIIKPITSRVLYTDSNAEPTITENTYGKGRVIYVNCPIENAAIDLEDSFEGNEYKLYRELFADKINAHSVKTSNPYLGLTSHKTENGILCILINYSPKPQSTALIIDGEITKIHYGDINIIPPFDFCIFEVK